jgi:hypothetical protein
MKITFASQASTKGNVIASIYMIATIAGSIILF